MRFQFIHPKVIDLYFSAMEMEELQHYLEENGWNNQVISKVPKNVVKKVEAKSKEFNKCEAMLLKAYKTPSRIQTDIDILCQRIGEC
jgi:hypothetical protein